MHLRWYSTFTSVNYHQACDVASPRMHDIPLTFHSMEIQTQDKTSSTAIGPLQRCTALLRLLATASARGLALTYLSGKTGLAHSTVHRLLAQMIRERLVQQLELNRCYALGPLAFELGVAAAQQFDIRGRCRPTLEKLALEVGDTIYLIMRSGCEAVCLDMVEGPSAIRVVTLRIGSRRPLGIGAGGLSILASLPTAERDLVLAEVTPEIEAEWGFSQPALCNSISDARRAGYAVIHNRVTPGVTAIGMSFSDLTGRTVGAVSIAAVNARLNAQRMPMLTAMLAKAVKQIEAASRGSSLLGNYSQETDLRSATFITKSNVSLRAPSPPGAWDAE